MRRQTTVQSPLVFSPANMPHGSYLPTCRTSLLSTMRVASSPGYPAPNTSHATFSSVRPANTAQGPRLRACRTSNLLALRVEHHACCKPALRTNVVKSTCLDAQSNKEGDLSPVRNNKPEASSSISQPSHRRPWPLQKNNHLYTPEPRQQSYKRGPQERKYVHLSLRSCFLPQVYVLWTCYVMSQCSMYCIHTHILHKSIECW